MEPLLMLSIGGVALLVILVLLFIFVPNVRGGKVEISENEVGLVYKKFAINPLRRNLKKGQLIAGRGEPGYQAYTLATGRHYGYWRWQYNIERVPLTMIPPGRIGLVVAEDGQTRLPHQLLGRTVECQDFQDGQAFLQNGGQKGRQLHILPGGAYRINTKMFTVINADNASQHGLTLQNLSPYLVEEGKIGIVSTLGGAPLPAGEVAGPVIQEHDNFQNPQAFIDAGGCRGLQEEYLSFGSYRFNPWFVRVKQIPLTNIPAGTVGVVISHVGKTLNTDSNLVKSEYNLVKPGYRGIWETPLLPGQHPINGQVMDVAIVPTNPIALDWSNKPKANDNYDAKLRKLQLLSKDGFLFEIVVTQVIRIDSADAPRMIASIGVPKTDEANLSTSNQIIDTNDKYTSIKMLVTKVLEPTIGSYFRNSAQGADALDFHNERITRQLGAKEYIDNALKAHGVRAVDTLINEIDLPKRLADQLMDRAVAEQESKTLEKQQLTQRKRQELLHEEDKFSVERARRRAEIRDYEAQAEASAIRQELMARAEALQAEVAAVGGPEFNARIQEAAERAKIVLPTTMISGSGSGGSSGFAELLIARMAGIESGQPQLTTKQQPEFTVKQIDAFVDALSGYVKEGGAEKIRNALMGHVIEQRQIGIHETSINDQDRKGTQDTDASRGFVVTGHRQIDLSDSQ